MKHEDLPGALNEVVGRLRALAPPNWRRIFLNREMNDDPEWGFHSSSQLYAIKKPLFGRAHTEDFFMDDRIEALLDQLGFYYMQQSGQKYVTLDLLIWHSGRFRAYLDYEPLLRLGGDITAGMRHRRYAQDDPLLADVREGKSG